MKAGGNLPFSGEFENTEESVMLLPVMKTKTSFNVSQYVQTTGSGKYDRCTCKICGKIFSQKGTAVRHVKSVHFLEKRIYCPNCTSSFKHKFHLKSHMELSCKKTNKWGDLIRVGSDMCNLLYTSQKFYQIFLEVGKLFVTEDVCLSIVTFVTCFKIVITNGIYVSI